MSRPHIPLELIDTVNDQIKQAVTLERNRCAALLIKFSDEVKPHSIEAARHYRIAAEELLKEPNP